MQDTDWQVKEYDPPQANDLLSWITQGGAAPDSTPAACDILPVLGFPAAITDQRRFIQLHGTFSLDDSLAWLVRYDRARRARCVGQAAQLYLVNPCLESNP